MIWERDYMKERSGEEGSASDVPADPTPPPFDIFAGLHPQELPPSKQGRQRRAADQKLTTLDLFRFHPLQQRDQICL